MEDILRLRFMKDLKSVFIGGKQIGADCLRSTVQAGFKPLFVVANPDDSGTDSWHESLVKVSKELGITCVTGEKPKNADVVQQIAEAKPDIIFCIGSTELIPPSILEVPHLGTINIHPALLPKYRGRYSIPHAIFAGEKEAGVTLHFMDAGIDSGPIILHASFPLTEDDTARTAYDAFTATGTKLFGDFLTMLSQADTITSQPQREQDATYFPKGLPNNGEIDWSWDGQKIRRFIRAMTFEPFPPPTFKIGGKTMAIADERSYTVTPQSDTKDK